MGGMGSGARRSTHVDNVENVLALDIRTLRRLGVVKMGECVIDAVRWSIDGLNAPSTRLRVDLRDIARGGTMTVRGDMSDGAINQHIAINAVPSAFSGWRCYFICPISARRCEILYYVGGRFASREAQQLSYAVQSMSDLARARRRAAKLRRRLKGSGSLPRPRGRNRIEIVQLLRDAEFEAKIRYLDRMRSFTERSCAQRTRRNRH